MKPSLCCFCKSAEAEEQQHEMQTAQLPLSHSIQVFILTISSRSKLRILCCGTNLQFQILCHLHHPRNLAAEFSPYSFGKLGTKTDATHWKQQSNTTFISSGTRNAAITAWPWMLKYEELDGQEQLVGHSQGNHPSEVTAYIPSSSSLNIPCCLRRWDMELGYWLTQLRVIALDKNLISGHHTFFCLDLPLLHAQIHSSAVCLLSHKKTLLEGIGRERYFACKSLSEGSQGEEVREGPLKVS